jgi:hypothetical protein
VVNYNFPVRPEMYRRRETELALLKGVKVRMIPPNGGSLLFFSFIFPPFDKEAMIYEFRITL